LPHCWWLRLKKRGSFTISLKIWSASEEERQSKPSSLEGLGPWLVGLLEASNGLQFPPGKFDDELARCGDKRKHRRMPIGTPIGR